MSNSSSCGSPNAGELSARNSGMSVFVVVLWVVCYFFFLSLICFCSGMRPHTRWFVERQSQPTQVDPDYSNLVTGLGRGVWLSFGLWSMMMVLHGHIYGFWILTKGCEIGSFSFQHCHCPHALTSYYRLVEKLVNETSTGAIEEESCRDTGWNANAIMPDPLPTSSLLVTWSNNFTYYLSFLVSSLTCSW